MTTTAEQTKVDLSKATPKEWSHVGCNVHDEYGVLVAKTSSTIDAVLIAKLKNERDELIQALREMVGLFGAKGFIRFDADRDQVIADAVRGARSILERVSK